MSAVEFKVSPVVERGRPLLTTYTLALNVDGQPIWPSRSPNVDLEIQIDDLLSHLAEYWKPLALRQTYPLTLNPARPAELLSEAKRAWGEGPQERAEYESREIERFRDCHDISRCFAGYFDLPPLWIIRSGDEMIVDTAECLQRVTYASALEALSSVGDFIADRLEQTSDDRWEDLLRRWRERNIGSPVLLLKWATSLDEPAVEQFVAEGLLQAPNTVDQAANDNDELRLAARMASALPTEQVRAVLDRVSKFPRVKSPQLRKLSKQAKGYLDSDLAGALPYEQGIAIADHVQQHLGVSTESEVDVFSIAESLGVQVYLEDAFPSTLDGLAVWGATHGPAVLLNVASSRHKGKSSEYRRRGQIRVTLAHELCHLLVDFDHAVSAVDVLNSRMPVIVEQRARAFAAEFLLPSRVAFQAWIDAGSPREPAELERVLRSLCAKFAVAKSVAAWKLEHGARRYDVDLRRVLDSIVPQR